MIFRLLRCDDGTNGVTSKSLISAAIFLGVVISAGLGVAPTACLAIEDSLNGVIAAKAARMRCLAVPEAHARHDPRFALADLVLESLVQLDDARWHIAPVELTYRLLDDRPSMPAPGQG